MTSYIAHFERIGRTHNVPDLDIEATHPDDIAARVYNYSRKYLASNDVFVDIDMETLKGTIGAGRFGRFTLEANNAA